MKIQLPNGQQTTLDENISLEEKLDVVDELLNEWDKIIHSNWESNGIKFFIDSLSNYLVWHKEDREKGKRGKEDKEILSKKKVEKLHKYKKTSREINFSDLPKTSKDLLLGERGAD
jgi:hypothetical protein